MAVLLQKTLTRTDLAAGAVKSARISLAKAQVRGALHTLLECTRRDDISSTDQALEALTTAAVALSASDPAGATWDLLLKSSYRSGHQAFFIEHAGEFLRGCNARPGDVWQLIRDGGKLAMRLIKAQHPSSAQGEEETEEQEVGDEVEEEEGCSSDVSDQQAIPACLPASSSIMSPVGGPMPAAALAAAASGHFGSSSSLASCQLAAGSALATSLPPSGLHPSADRKRSAASAGLDPAGPDASHRTTPSNSPAVGSSSAVPLAPASAAAPLQQFPSSFALPPGAFSSSAHLPRHPQHQPLTHATTAAQAVQAQAVAYAAWPGAGWAVVQQHPHMHAHHAAVAAHQAAGYYPATATLQPTAAVAVAAPSGISAGGVAVHLPVTCNGLQGLLDVTDLMVVVGPGGGQHQGTRVLPEVFEALAGKSTTRKWRRSLVVHPGAADPSLTSPVTLGEWLARHPHLEARLPPRGSGRAAARAALGAMADADGGASTGGTSDAAPSSSSRRSGDGSAGAPPQQVQQPAPHPSRRDASRPRSISLKGASAAAAGTAARSEAPSKTGGSAAAAAPAATTAAAAPQASAPGNGAVRWLAVRCINLSGWLDLSDFTVTVANPKGDAVRLSPAEFEALAGKASTRKWRRSLVVQPGGDEPKLKEPITIGEWMRRHNVQGALGALPGTSPVPPSGPAAPPAAAPAVVAPAAPRAQAQPAPAPSRVQLQAQYAAATTTPVPAAPAAAAPAWRPSAASTAPRTAATAAPLSPPPRSETPQLLPVPAPASAAAAVISSGSGLAVSRSDDSDEWLEDLLCDIGGAGCAAGMATLSDLGVEDAARLIMCGRAPSRPPSAAPPGVVAAAAAAAAAAGVLGAAAVAAGTPGGAVAVGLGASDDDDAAALILPASPVPVCTADWLAGW